MPGLIGRITESRINRAVSFWFKSFMIFVFGANSPACSLTPVDLIKSAFVYLTSSGVLYQVIQGYMSGRTHVHSVREAFMAGLVVLVADLSHRYAGTRDQKEYAFKKAE
jgi:hypothetical protein